METVPSVMDSELYQYFFATFYISLDRIPKTDINQDVSSHVETVVGLHRKDM